MGGETQGREPEHIEEESIPDGTPDTEVPFEIPPVGPEGEGIDRRDSHEFDGLVRPEVISSERVGAARAVIEDIMDRHRGSDPLVNKALDEARRYLEGLG